MKAAMLCPGPSLWKFRGHGQYYDLMIGINRAVLAVPCDWWSFNDLPIFHNVHPDNEPRIWTRQSFREEITADYPRDLHRVTVHEDYFDQFPTATCWTKYSSLAGLVLAAVQGVTHLHCYGCDMAGTAEFDGKAMPDVNRGTNRWADERWWWDKTAEMLVGRGMTINRVL